MSWLQEYYEFIVALEQTQANWLLDTNFDKFQEEFKEIFAPLEDDSLDPGDLEVITDKWWKKYKLIEVAAAKQAVRIHRRLAPLYERLEYASEEEWDEFSKMCLRARWTAGEPLLQKLLKHSPIKENEQAGRGDSQ